MNKTMIILLIAVLGGCGGGGQLILPVELEPDPTSIETVMLPDISSDTSSGQTSPSSYIPTNTYPSNYGIWLINMFSPYGLEVIDPLGDNDWRFVTHIGGLDKDGKIDSTLLIMNSENIGNIVGSTYSGKVAGINLSTRRTQHGTVSLSFYTEGSGYAFSADFDGVPVPPMFSNQMSLSRPSFFAWDCGLGVGCTSKMSGYFFKKVRAVVNGAIEGDYVTVDGAVVGGYVESPDFEGMFGGEKQP